MRPPTVREALGQGARAVGRAGWLVPAGFALWLAGRVATFPAWLFAGAVAARGLEAGAILGGPASALGGAAAALTAPRTLAVFAGLLLGGLALRGALRALWLAGALPTLGEALARRHVPAFAAGASWGYPRMLGAALLAFLLEGAAGLVAAGALFGAVLAVAHYAGNGGRAGFAAVTALALTAAAAVPLLAGVVADASLARVGLRGDGPLAALGEAARRFGARPAAFLAAAMAVGLAALLLGGSAELAMGTIIQATALRAAPVLILAPQLLAAAISAMLAVAFELWRLGAVAVLACHEGR